MLFMNIDTPKATERLRKLAAELVTIQPDVILAIGGDVAPFARAATSTIPIVMVVSIDPVESGLVASGSRSLLPS